MRYKLRNEWSEHPVPEVARDTIFVEAISWRPGSTLPSWCAYCVDPNSVPGRLLVVSPHGESVAQAGDMLVRAGDGTLLVMDIDQFSSHYKEAIT